MAREADVKVVLITGAAQRVGEYLARSMAQKGWAIALHYHGSVEQAATIASEIRALGGHVEIFQADFAVEEEVASLVDAVVTKMGRLDALINNASVFEYDSVETASRQSWDMHLDVNLRAPFVLTQAFAQQCEEGGAVINIIDQRVWNLTPHFMTYTLSKAALWTLTQTMAMALAPSVRVNAIGPGPTLANVRQSAEDFQAQFEAVPLQRQTELVDILDAVMYILGARSMTGQMIALDGGEHLGWAQGDNHTPPRE